MRGDGCGRESSSPSFPRRASKSAVIAPSRAVKCLLILITWDELLIERLMLFQICFLEHVLPVLGHICQLFVAWILLYSLHPTRQQTWLWRRELDFLMFFKVRMGRWNVRVTLKRLYIRDLRIMEHQKTCITTWIEPSKASRHGRKQSIKTGVCKN